MATILVVDDLASNRGFLVTLLSYLGHRVIEAGDGRQGLAAARADRPDLIIADILMPVMDGFEMVRELRESAETHAIPVIFCTAHYAAREARELAASTGVARVLTKPAEAEDVVQAVADVLAGRTAPVPAGVAPGFDREHLRLVTDKLQENTESLRAANARLSAVINIGLRLASERDPVAILQRVCDDARELFGATYVTLGIVDRGSPTLRHLMTSGVGGGTRIDCPPDQPGALGPVIADRRVVRGDRRSDPAFESPPGHPDVDTYLAAPVASPVHVYGWICLVSNEGRVFTTDDGQLLTALAGLVGRVYENGHFYRVAAQRADALEREIAAREATQAALGAEREALRQAEERTRFALEGASVGIWDQDFLTGVLAWSDTLQRQYGLEPGTFGGHYADFIALVHPDDRDALAAAIDGAVARGGDFSVQYRAIRPDGAVRWMNGAGRIYLGPDGQAQRAIGISIDVTDRHTLEAQYQQAQKMEAIGRLAGGVAHDFNNLLTAILGYCHILLDDFGEDDPRREDVNEIHRAGVLAAALTRQLLAFSRKQIIEPVVLNLNEVLSAVQPMLARLLGEDVSVTLRLAPGLGAVRADRSQIEQVVLNLAVNARDAMPLGGMLMIETANVTFDESYAARNFSVVPGSYVALIVTDSGVGMTPEVQTRLFEPFFTTKEPGKGTGLGLATVHGIVSSAGGLVHAYSEVGHGSSFKIYLPRLDTRVPPPTISAEGSAARGEQQLVLVVDDSDALRRLATRLLESLNYRVLTAANAAEALVLVAEHRSIALLLTDVVMPGASGPELMRRVLEDRSDLKVIFMSGYTEEAVIRDGVLNAGVAFLQKPFTAEALGQKVKDLLSR